MKTKQITNQKTDEMADGKKKKWKKKGNKDKNERKMLLIDMNRTGEYLAPSHNAFAS